MSEVLSDAWRKEHVKKGDDRSDEGDRPVTDIDLDAIRARADAATPGPWELTGLCEDPGDEGWWIHNGNQGADEYAVALSLPYNPRGEADAEFIAAARADVPTLIARLAEVEAERDGKEAALVAAEEVLARLALPPDVEANRQYGRKMPNGLVIASSLPDPTHYRLLGPWTEVTGD